ncbi:hypothetical protein [Heyndrickxia sporothermodurans]|uniref:Uncharacterized protein n=1 Tax=Heyndrickxia sporothermodurans TaxID=46224 RepID=A0AB37HDS3_9BACI|nr:hypothetical protein [Heyndrickxia sporothermodurans]MBL5768019.1 hypothetical protein [Heyndrickxia sporothermodurans]MBL5771613.1 hypothetical protein [Heyndrickxia sporothermodurans]MBL5785899.1 hypothetical protein [Heyndrickxia sporothermodurans]MBL5789405.1 hypothetical protein [Heyndrickxia sporothermodurans]MBL5796656.1 hypothetical protein [Heyndrickxia sporothermodurans]
MNEQKFEIQKSLEIANSIIKLASREGWSEEELAKAVNLLHSELEKTINSITISNVLHPKGDSSNIEPSGISESPNN